MRRPLLVFTLVALGVVLADQLSKYAVREALPAGSSIALIPGVIRLTHIFNEGAAFGMLQGGRLLFIAVSIGVLAAVGIYWYRVRPTQWPLVVALGLICGGGIGNLIDRASVGQVTDFLETVFISFPVFNIADSAIVVGTIVLVLWLLFGPDEGEHGPQDEAGEGTESPGATPAGEAQ